MTVALAARRLVAFVGPSGAVVARQRTGTVATRSEWGAVGYRAHDAERASLYLAESFAFRVIEPDAVVSLRSGN